MEKNDLKNQYNPDKIKSFKQSVLELLKKNEFNLAKFNNDFEQIFQKTIELLKVYQVDFAELDATLNMVLIIMLVDQLLNLNTLEKSSREFTEKYFAIREKIKYLFKVRTFNRNSNQLSNLISNHSGYEKTTQEIQDYFNALAYIANECVDLQRTSIVKEVLQERMPEIDWDRFKDVSILILTLTGDQYSNFSYGKNQKINTKATKIRANGSEEYLLIPYDVADPNLIVHELRHTRGGVNFGENIGLNSGVNEALTQWGLGLFGYASQQYVLEKIFLKLPSLQKELDDCYYEKNFADKDQAMMNIYSKIYNEYGSESVINFTFMGTKSYWHGSRSKLFIQPMQAMQSFTESNDPDLKYINSQFEFLKFIDDWDEQSGHDPILIDYFKRSYSPILSLPIKYHPKRDEIIVKIQEIIDTKNIKFIEELIDLINEEWLKVSKLNSVFD